MSDIYVLVDRDYDAHQFAIDYLNSTKFNMDQQANWDEERIDIIGQNGNEGCHYQQSVEYYPPGQYIKYDSKPTEKDFLNKLINDHWKYIEGVLDKAGTYESQLKEIEYHYKTAFAHGWKHHAEYVDANHA
jgi:hypothetical protein